ncbi:MAG: class I SAM-dependent methyltransferase [Pseudomonadota bacterium]
MTAEMAQDEQALLWNGTAGKSWIAAEASVDVMYRPFEDLLVAATPPGRRVLDIGCGTGSTTRAVARAAGECVGVDISAPMIAAAAARAAREGVNARFICADAEVHDFAPASFDLVMSRFGVMFFADPSRAFANLRRATRAGGRLHAFVWREAAENDFMTRAERAAAHLLPPRPERAPDAPGPFAFARPERVRGILQDGGWSGIDIAKLDIECAFPERELLHYLTWMGPVGRILQQADAPVRTKVMDTVRAAFDPFVHGDEVRFTAACWSVDAHA